MSNGPNSATFENASYATALSPTATAAQIATARALVLSGLDSYIVANTTVATKKYTPFTREEHWGSNVYVFAATRACRIGSKTGSDIAINGSTHALSPLDYTYDPNLDENPL